MHVLRAIAFSAAVTVALAAQARAVEAISDPGAQIALSLAADGTLSASGTLPPGVAPEDLAAALPNTDVTGVDRADGGPQWQVAPALDALSIVLPRFRTAEVRLGENTLAVEGRLRSGLSAAGVQAALRAALGAGWRLDLNLSETAPQAEIVLSQSGEGAALSGLLPAGLDPAEALKLLGRPATGLGLAGGGDGSAGEWSETLAAMGETLDLFASATARVAQGSLAVEGVLRPGYPRATVADRLRAELPAGWRVELDADEMPPSEGDRRVSLDTGTQESFRRGYWLPEVAFPVSTQRCEAEAEAALAGDGLPFVESGAEIDERGLQLVNRLAAIAVRCLNSSPLRLEIGGHTDSVGNDATNQALSQARAEAVRQALVDRGVREESVTATGHGESRPVATNNTPDGRARNRRIDFDWYGPEG
jgi:OmpA-OmpF porin, OOP family